MTWNKTNIGWTDITWNVYHGCAKTSEGCSNCYAADLSNRQQWTDEPWTIINLDDNFIVYPDAFTEPDNKDPQWVWGASMSDPWVPALPPVVLMMQVGKMWANPQHQFLLLSKWGPDRARSDRFPDAVVPPLPENIALGVSVETQRRTYRLDWLREQDATWKFVSFEPLLEGIEPDLTGIDWAIIGGESGDNRREWDATWAVDLYWECQRQDTAYFFKQHGDRFPEERTKLVIDGEPREYREFPDTPKGLPSAPREHLN